MSTSKFLYSEEMADSVPDDELVRRAQSGEREAFSLLVARYYHMVYIVAYGYLKGHEAAEDLAQETFLRAYASLSSMRDGRYFPAWLNQIARNHALNWLKQGTRRSRVLTMLPIDNYKDQPDTAGTCARDAAAANEQAQQLEEAVLGLPEDLRTTILLHYTAGLSKSEIARRLGVHPSSVGRQLDKALELLRRKLGHTPDSSAIPVPENRKGVTKAIAVVTAFSALSANSQAALMQAGGGNVLMPPAMPSFASKVSSLTGFGSALTWLVGAVAVIVLAVGGAAVLSMDSQSPGGQVNGRRVARVTSSALGAATSGTEEKKQPRSARSDANPAVLSVSSTPVFLIHGTVWLPDSKPAANTKVEIVLEDEPKEIIASTSTDRDGNYQVQFEHTVESEYESVYAQASYPGFLTTKRRIFVGSNPTGMNPFKKQQDIELLPATELAGVVTTQNDVPIANARVKVCRIVSQNQTVDAMPEAVTQADGSFELSPITSGTSIILVEAEGYVPWVGEVTAPTDPLRVQLKDGGASVVGVVYQEETSAPVAGAELKLTSIYDESSTRSQYANRTAITDAAGAFQFEKLPAADYLVQFDKENKLFILPGPAPSQTVISARPGAPLPQSLYFHLAEDSSKTLTIPVYEGHTVSGRVTEKSTGNPLADVTVYIGSKPGDFNTTTAADGSYRLENIPVASSHIDKDLAPGFYLRVEKPGFVLPGGEHDYPGLRMWLKEDKRHVTQDLELVGTVPVSGIVLTPDGRPVAGARVTRISKSGLEVENSLITDATGRFIMDAESYKKLQLHASAPGFAFGYAAKSISGDAVDDMDIALKVPGEVSGAVLDEYGNPIADAELNVSLLLWNEERNLGYPLSFTSIKSDKGGRFHLADVPPYDITIQAAEQASGRDDSAQFTLHPGEHKQDVVVVKRQGQTVRGQVVRSDGSPAAAIRVEALISVSNTRMESAVTDENGRFELTHLVKIPDALSLTDNNTWRRDEVDISGMDLANLKVRFDGDGVTLHGRVVDYKSRAPIGQANVSLYGREVETGTAGPGTFTAPGLMRGAVNTFRVSAPGYVPATFEITAKPGDSQIEHTVHLGPGGKITGRLLTEKGEPATDREVVLVLGNQQYSVAELERHGATRTDQGGWFHFEAIPPGWATVIVRPEAPLAPIYEAVEVQHGEETQVGNLELGRGSNVVVTVVDATSGKPVSGAEVRISGTGISWGKTANTDATGQVRVAGAYGSETIVSIPQYHVYESFETDEEKLIERTFEVGQADLRGTMVRNGHPLFGEVGISRPGTVIRPLSTDSQGRFIIRNLAAGRWDLRFVYHEDSSAEKVEWETTIEIPATGLEREFEVR